MACPILKSRPPMPKGQTDPVHCSYDESYPPLCLYLAHIIVMVVDICPGSVSRFPKYHSPRVGLSTLFSTFSFIMILLPLNLCMAPMMSTILRCVPHLPTCDITRFFPRIDRIFSGEALNPFFGAQDEGFSEFRSR